MIHNREVLVEWESLSERENDYYTVEKSTDGVEWIIVGTVQGVGTSLEAISYSLVDSEPLVGQSYYRLKQTDFNGVFEYFDIVSVSMDMNANDIYLYPNPARDQLTIVGNSIEFASVHVFDMLGKEVNIGIVDGNEFIMKIDVSTLPAGMYTIRTLNQVKRFVKE